MFALIFSPTQMLPLILFEEPHFEYALAFTLSDRFAFVTPDPTVAIPAEAQSLQRRATLAEEHTFLCHPKGGGALSVAADPGRLKMYLEED